MTAALLALLLLQQDATGDRIGARAAPESLVCPETLGAFFHDAASETGDFCAYSHSSGADARIWLQDAAAPADEAADRVATLLDRRTPQPFDGRVLHLGETDAGDLREEVWLAAFGGREILIRSRYAIPGFARAPLIAFGEAFSLENGLVPETETAAAPGDCPAPPDGFTREERLTGIQAGAAAQWSCAYVSGNIFGFYYAPIDSRLAHEGFDGQLSDGAEAVSAPAPMPAAERLVIDQQVYRGQWLRGEGPDARALEIDWETAEETPQAAALARALGF